MDRQSHSALRTRHSYCRPETRCYHSVHHLQVLPDALLAVARRREPGWKMSWMAEPPPLEQRRSKESPGRFSKWLYRIPDRAPIQAVLHLVPRLALRDR